MDENESPNGFDEDFWSEETEFSDEEFAFLSKGLEQLVPQDLTQSGSYNLTEMKDASLGRFLQMIPLDAFLVDESRSIVFTNNSLAGKINAGYGLVGTPFSSSFVRSLHAKKAGALLEKAFKQRRSWIIEAAMRIGNKKSFQRLHLRPVRMMNGRFVLVLLLDLTAVKVQDALNKKYRQLSQSLEAKVKERTQHVEDSRKEIQDYAAKLEQANDALRVLISGIEAQKKSIEKRIAENIQSTVKPILDQLKIEDLPSGIRPLIDSLEKNLDDIASSLCPSTVRYGNLLTFREIRICEMIKSGLSSKEIAKAMQVTTQTIFFHRSNIRKKLGLTGNSDDLATCLKSMN
jgi:DNA-binding CsgD family transcriptional regulator